MESILAIRSALLPELRSVSRRSALLVASLSVATLSVATLSVATLLSVLFLAPIASAAGAGAGGVNGGGGGGRMVPGRDAGSAELTKLFEEGVAFLTGGECKRAEKKFRRVLKTVPRNSQVNYLRGVSLQCQDKHKLAVRYFKRSKRDDEQFYRAYTELGMSYLVLDRGDLARPQLAALDKMKSTCQDRCPADLLKAAAKLRNALDRLDGLPSDPVKTDQHGLLFDPVGQPQASYLAAISLIHSERFEEAIQTLRLLLSTLGPHPDVLNYLGYSNRRLGHFEKAQRYYEQALAIDPKHRGANEYLGEMWVELGRSEEARARLSALEDACPFGCVEYEDLRRLIERRLVAAN
jgi:Flp pilus assembly protein TadD